RRESGPDFEAIQGQPNQYHARPGFSLQLRTSQTKTSPAIADPIPIRRREISGVSSTLVIALLADSGNAAKIRPSMTKTNPSAARKSDIPVVRVRYRDGVWAAGGVAGLSRILPDGSPKYLKKLESGLSSMRVSFCLRPRS